MASRGIIIYTKYNIRLTWLSLDIQPNKILEINSLSCKTKDQPGLEYTKFIPVRIEKSRGKTDKIQS